MKRKEGFVLREVCGERVIVGEGLGAVDFGRLLSVNETAAWIWNHAEGDFTIDTLTAALCEEYDVSQEEAHKDVEEIIAKFKEVGIVA